MVPQRLLGTTLESTSHLHADLLPLWDDLEPNSRRAIVATGFCLIVRQHAVGQYQLLTVGLDVSAAALVRPCYESLVRGIWSMHCADDAWIAGFLSPRAEAVQGDAETRKGPPVDTMLDSISRKEPAHVYGPLANLKDQTWRAMHSYVHGGIRPMVQALNEVSQHEAAGVLINANVMLMMATEAARIANGLRSPDLPAMWSKHSTCLP